MDDYEKYFFDLNGYLVVPDALTANEIAECNAAIDSIQDRIRERPDRLSAESIALKGKQGREDLVGMLTWPKPWFEPFRNLLGHQAIVPHLVEILRDGFRLDHLYGIVMREGTEGLILHGGGTTDDFSHFYQFHNGRMRCGLTVVAWALTDCNPGDGGFACIPGSHKSNYSTPRDVALMDKDIGVVTHVPAKAGSAIIFTEALTHGTLPWKASHERRAVLYKYSPGPLANEPHPSADVGNRLDELTQEQRALLEPPYQDHRASVAGG